MKKLFLLISCLFLLQGCVHREDFYVFSFDDYTLSVGYDNVEFLELVFDADLKEELEAGETLKDVEVTFFDKYFASVDITNYKDKNINISEGIISRADFFLDNINMNTYMLDGKLLSSSVKENCQMFDGEYIERNGYACLIYKQVDDKNNIVILHGDLFKEDQDELSRIEIYVE